MTYPKRGEVWLVNLDPTVGAEIQKTRPAVIYQNDIANRYSPIVIVLPLTSRPKKRVDEALVKAPEGGLTRDSVVVLNQIRAIDKKRLVKRLGRLSSTTLRYLDAAIQLVLGILPI